MERSNAEWLTALNGGGDDQVAALTDLRASRATQVARISRGARVFLFGRPRGARWRTV